jgi:hypothetical protein
MNDTVVLFDDLTARILQGVDGSLYLGNPKALVNPVFPPGIPPHCWRLEDGKIAVHHEVEITRRETILHDSAIPQDALPVVSRFSKTDLLLRLSLCANAIAGIYFIFKLFHS